MEVIKGRMYDYNNGRFLSVDPFIQSPTSTQSMNPYTYIFNNPLSGTDPTGYKADIEENTKTKNVAPTGSHIKSGKRTTGKNSEGGTAFIEVYNGKITSAGGFGTLSVTGGGKDGSISNLGDEKNKGFGEFAIGIGKTALKETLHSAHTYITGVSREEQGDPTGLSPSNTTQAAGAQEYYDHSFVYDIGLGIITYKISTIRKSSNVNRVVVNPRTRLPKNNGYWKGKPGNGFWYSDNAAVRRITGGKPIEFINGRPDFSPWVTDSLKFKKGVLNGTKNDFNLVYDSLISRYDLPSRSAAKRLLDSMGVSPHHYNNTTIQLVPKGVHSVPHIGSASDLRGGY